MAGPGKTRSRPATEPEFSTNTGHGGGNGWVEVGAAHTVDHYRTSIISNNAQTLRKSSTLGSKYFSINDSCIMCKINMIVTASMGAGITVLVVTKIANKTSSRTRKPTSPPTALKASQAGNTNKASSQNLTIDSDLAQRRSFKQNCVG
ncbi:unnamed protein product [Phytophthora fragariaefolia]|uniref:Unnamed protein product n=1 Tax=Phytophthora fragariaefolia TaxID=1490495 RepID=A0A9W6Y4U1_9STRA|nr:unnamed protein product [Phytophthora fragariaefolia]